MDLTPSPADTTSSSPQHLILLVSADAQEVANVQLGLEDMQSKWSIEVAQDAASAVAASQRKSFDAAVVDLLLPNSAGAGLLKEIMERSPDTLRIGLTTAPERQAIQAVGAPAHQLLSKPCDPKALKAVLARAFASRDFLAHDQIKQLVAGISALPVLPQIYSELMQELKSEEPSLERAGQIVARDMALTAKILSLVNSAFFGLGRTIAHPSEAAMFLGSETLKALVLSLQVFSQFSHLGIPDWSVENLWKHSWATGVLAKRLCEFEEAERTAIDEAFISGLLHDVGKLVLAANYPAKLQENIERARQKNITFWEQEYASYNASHAELGGYLLSQWGLPAGVVEAVAFHHRPSQARRQSFSALTAVHVANTLGKKGRSECHLIPQAVDVDYLRSLGLHERVDGWRQFLSDSLEERG